MTLKKLSKLLFITYAIFYASLSCAAGQRPIAALLEIDGAIGPAMLDYVDRGFAKAAEDKASLIIIRIDTPGGLETSMRDINRLILSSKVPVVAYVAPSGARAASAGTFILYASHIAAMAPGTNIGAASPVDLGATGNLSPGTDASKRDHADTMKLKASNDAAAYIRSLAELRGRNVAWGEKAVREADSLTASQALNAGVINIVADDLNSLLQQLNGRKIMIANDLHTITTSNIQIVTIKPDWRTKILLTITDPNIAYILLLAGIYGLILEFYNPGSILPGVVGTICILVASYAFKLLPISFVGLALLLVGIVFMITEAFVTSFGILAIGGVIAFVIGSVMLIDTQTQGFQIALPLILSMGLVSVVFILLAAGLTIKTFGIRVMNGKQGIIGKEGKVITSQNGKLTVRVLGEMWRARSSVELQPDQLVKVTEIKGLELTVEPLDNNS